MRTKIAYYCFTICLFIGLPFNSIGQVEQFNIYQVQVGAFQGDVDLNQFKDLQDLGEVTTRSIRFGGAPNDGYTRVFVGKFLGEKTALKMLEIIRKRGYPDAVFNVDNVNLNISDGRFLIYTLQMGAHKRKFNIKKYNGYGEFVLYENGFYKICYGLYASEDVPKLRKEIIPNIRKKRLKPFPKRFRQ
ncbi:MAG: SPOR domain-containing protein [Bacteroidota bacterium]